MAKITKDEWKIRGNVFDQFTLRTLHWLENQDHYTAITQAIEVGKEANVFVAQKEDGSNIIVKIYRLENCNFNTMFDYLRGDPRFPSLKPRKREIVFAWTLREYRNLLVARQAGVRVPTPFIQKNNVLLEEFLGTATPAEKLKDVLFESDAEVEQCAKEVIAQMRLLYQKANIVHGDLSGFNILYVDKKPVLIDFSQATSIKDSMAQTYLQRDIKNIVTLFEKRGIVLDADSVYNTITK